MDKESKSADVVSVPQHYYEQYVNQFAYFTYEVTSSALDAVRLQFDIWLSAEQFVTTIMGASAKTRWGRRDGAVVATGLLQSVSAAVYAQRSAELAWHMWKGAGGLHDMGMWEYWRYAQNHVLALTKHTIQAAKSGTNAALALTHFFEKFSPVHYLDEIRKQAYFLWEQRGCPERQALDDWLHAESKILGDAKIAS